MREYTFTTNGAPKTLKETIRADGTTTGAATTGVNQSLTYDTADRLTGGYAYDLLGRQTTVPAAHAPNTAGGDITLAYFDSDLPAKVTQGGTATSFTLDVTLRRLVQTTASGGTTTTTTRHYTDSSDNPAWIETNGPSGASETLRYVSSIGGELGASIDADGGVSLMLPNSYGDVVTTVPVPSGTSGSTPAMTIAGWSSYNEYGASIDPSQSAMVGTNAGYGWLGSKERSTTAETVGLSLLGVRYYNQVTGSFTTDDPIRGANSTAYGYPTDPVNHCDPSGMASCSRKKEGGKDKLVRERRQYTRNWYDTNTRRQVANVAHWLIRVGMGFWQPWTALIPLSTGVAKTQSASYWNWKEYRYCGTDNKWHYWYKGYSYKQSRTKYSVTTITSKTYTSSWQYSRAMSTGQTGKVYGRLPG